MIHKNSLMLALLIPFLATVSACKGHDADDAAPAPVPAADATPPPPDAAAAPAPMAPSAMPAAAAGDTPFADLDKNHDGSLTKDELPDGEMLKDHFSKADTNGDGKLSEDEVASHRAAMAAAAPTP
ncbi:MAG: EF-hand domain-containing protein [Luteimonas sp.]